MAWIDNNQNSKEIEYMHDPTTALHAAEALYKKKAQDIVALDVSTLTIITDYMVIASGRSAIQVKTLAEDVEEALAKEGLHVRRREGQQEGRWVVLDYGTIMVHVFHQEERAYYNLERLWEDGGNRMQLPFDQSDSFEGLSAH